MFKVGDVVRLKSGGPDMTVFKLNATNTVECMWFLNSKPESYWFITETLEAVKRELAVPARPSMP
jgi:uncharacterized protein YodC (DUF2158 family)